MTKEQEVIELLEKAIEVFSWCQENADEKWMKDHLMAVRIDIDQALALLKQPECKTCLCMDCGKVIKVTEQSKHLKECPKKTDCKKQLTAQEIIAGVAKAQVEEKYGSVANAITEKCKPKCQKPPASEFTKECRETLRPLEKREYSLPKLIIYARELESRVSKLSGRLDKAEAENKDLKEKLGAESYRFREQKQVSKQQDKRIKDLKAQVDEYMRMKE